MMQPLVIDVRGDDLDIGRQHAQGAFHLRSHVSRWVAAALERHPLDDPGTQERLSEVTYAWQTLTPGTLDQITGMAEVYQIPTKGLMTAVLDSYLQCFDQAPGAADGCTTVALSGAGHPLLAKNRDNDRRFLGMQTVVRVRPNKGHSWLALSTAGAPGAHSSGVNDTGLCVADTHVPSSDVGPGVPRFSAMMHVLQRCSTVDDALQYVLTTPQMGLGTLTLVDAKGHVAVVECAYSGSVVLPQADAVGLRPGVAVLATNHFVTPHLATSLLEPEAGTPGANSRARWALVRRTLTGWAGRGVDSPTAVLELAGSHVGVESHAGLEAGSLCQHGPGLKAETVSTAIYDPIERRMDLCLGRPCSAPFTRVSFTEPAPAP